MSKSTNNELLENEISLIEILDFLFDFWKLILFSGVIGLLISWGFMIAKPKEYEATAHIKMAQIYTTSNTNPLGINVEDVNALIVRMRLPSAYSLNEIKACNLENSEYPSESLVGLVKFHAIKEAPSIIELKIRASSKDQAIKCMQALYKHIQESQAQMIKPLIEEANSLLLKYEVRLKNIQSLISQLDVSSATISAVYLINRDELKFLADEIIRLKSIISSSNNRQSELVTPIYVTDSFLSVNMKFTLLIGFSAGLFLGFLTALGLKIWCRYQSNRC